MSSDEAGVLVARLRAAGCVYAEDEAAVILETAENAGDLARLVAERVSGRPLEQVVGWADFAGVRVLLDPGVFVPRRRSSLLVRIGAELAPDGAVVVDLCCGSGALASALLARRPTLEVHAADVDPVAVACARRNLVPERVHQGDLFAALPTTLLGRVALVVMNAPYVPSGEIVLMPREARDHEPRHTLDGGPDGLALHRRAAVESGRWLAPGGHLLVETSRSQADRAVAAMVAGGLQARVLEDADLDATAVLGRRPSAKVEAR